MPRNNGHRGRNCIRFCTEGQAVTLRRAAAQLFKKLVPSWKRRLDHPHPKQLELRRDDDRWPSWSEFLLRERRQRRQAHGVEQ